MKNPDLAARVAEAAVEAVDVPVTVKCVLVGIVTLLMSWILQSALSLQVWLLLPYMVVQRQMYSGHADWSYIKARKKLYLYPYLAMEI